MQDIHLLSLWKPIRFSKCRLMTRLALMLYFMLRFFFPQEWPLLFCLWETCSHWIVCPLLILPPMSLVFRQLQFCPFWLNILCCWKLLTALKHEPQSHASKPSLGSRGSHLHLAGTLAECGSNQAAPRIACVSQQGCSSTQKPEQAAANKGGLKCHSPKTVSWTWRLLRHWRLWGLPTLIKLISLCIISFVLLDNWIFS